MFAFLTLAALAAQPAAPAPARIDAATIAAAIQPRLPQRFSADATLVAAAARGDLLVLTVEATAGKLAELTPAGVGRAVAAGFCGAPGAREAMAGRLSLRVDARAPGGQAIVGEVLETCPLAGPDGPLPPPR